MALVQQALSLAEEWNLPYYRLTVRYELIWAYTIGSDPAKALPVCAEFFALLGEYPDAMTHAETQRNAVSTAMVAAHVACSLPQIPLEQCQALIEQFHDQVKQYGMGERLWQIHTSYFCLLTGNLPGAESHLQAFWETPRDALSDCEACEVSNAAEILLGLGQREKARQILRPVLDGSKRCNQQPWSALSMLIHDALDYGEIQQAKVYGRHLLRHSITGSKDLMYIGALLRLQAYDQENSSIELLENGIRWAIGVWDQELLFHVYRGAWTFCAKLGEQINTIPLHLPTSFPPHQEDGIYTCSYLSQWFHRQAEAIAQRFDQRNGSDYYGRKLMDRRRTPLY